MKVEGWQSILLSVVRRVKIIDGRDAKNAGVIGKDPCGRLVAPGLVTPDRLGVCAVPALPQFMRDDLTRTLPPKGKQLAWIDFNDVHGCTSTMSRMPCQIIIADMPDQGR